MHWGRSCPRDTQPAAACHPAIADGARAGQDAPTENGREQPMGIVEILGVAGSLSLLAGWRLYLTILATGVAMRFGWLPLPEHLQALQILASPWILGVAALGTLAEFFADKVAWVDSIWDGIHSIGRPLGDRKG